MSEWDKQLFKSKGCGLLCISKERVHSNNMCHIVQPGIKDARACRFVHLKSVVLEEELEAIIEPVGSFCV